MRQGFVWIFVGSLIVVATCSAISYAQQPQEPTPLSCEDQLAVSRMQIDGLKAALRLKDAEITMLRARLEIDQHTAEVKKHGAAIEGKEQSLKGKYQVPVGYVLTEDVQWKKGPAQGITVTR